ERRIGVGARQAAPQQRALGRRARHRRILEQRRLVEVRRQVLLRERAVVVEVVAAGGAAGLEREAGVARPLGRDLRVTRAAVVARLRRAEPVGAGRLVLGVAGYAAPRVQLR